MRYAWLVGALVATACSDALEKTSPVGQEIAVLNQGGQNLSLINAGDFTVQTLPLLSPVAQLGTVSGQDQVVLVPTGSGDAVQALELGAAGRNIPLASGSGATGAAFQTDTLAWVANPGLNTITQINVVTGDTIKSLAVGPQPVAVAIVAGRVFSINSNAVGDSARGPSSLTAWSLSGTGAPDTIPLTGTNARYALVGDDSLLYVVQRGDSGQANGRMSIVDPARGLEMVVLNGLGELPGPAVYHPSGRILVASASEGVLEVDALQRSVTRGPGNGVKPSGHGIVALALDLRGRVYAVDANGCATPGVTYVLSPPPDYHVIRAVPVGLCPRAATIAEMPPQ